MNQSSSDLELIIHHTTNVAYSDLELTIDEDNTNNKWSRYLLGELLSSKSTSTKLLQ